jgi:hypothetical protein
VSVNDVFGVANSWAPTKSGASSSWSVYVFAPGSGFQRKIAGLAGKLSVAPSDGESSIGDAPQAFVKLAVALSGPTPVPPSVAATRQ